MPPATRYGRSPWIDSYPASRAPAYPRHRGRAEAAAVVVGGGLTGCATAYAFAAHGLSVILLEAERIGRGSSGASAGWFGTEPGAAFADVERALGRRAARHAWQAWRRAALDFAALARRLRLTCHLEPRDTILLAARPDQAVRLARERKLRREAGLDAAWLNRRAIAELTAIDAPAAIRTHGGAVADPYRACLGLAAAARARGARIFERSPVRQIAFGRRSADVLTEGGAVRADVAVVATGAPTPLFKPLMRHFWYRAAYHALTAPIPARLRRQLGRREAVVRDWSAPPHVIRWTGDDRLLVTGADGAAPPSRAREKTIVQRTGQLMYELSTIYPDISGIRPDYGWDAPFARTGDGLPYFGPHRNFPRHLFAFGDASYGLTGAYLASRILLRHYLGAPDPADQAFAFTR